MSTETAPQPSAKTRATYDRVLAQVAEMTAMAADDGLLAKKSGEVSQWTIGQHLEHMALAAKGMLTLMFMILNSKNPSTAGGPKLPGKIVLWTGRIPRGKGKSPAEIQPKSGAPDEVRKNVQMLEGFIKGLAPKLGAIDASQGKAPHPALGSFTPAQWLRFIDIHTGHHFKIIRDIRKKA